MVLQDQQDEEDLGEIPDEFMDPVMCTLMSDPVKLPSGVVMDSATVRTHLLSDPHDPFSRLPMTFEDCVPRTLY
jgi:ubiquitin conjugation factor E4 B